MTLLFGLLQRLISVLLAVIGVLGLQFNTVTVELYENPSSGYDWEYSYDKSGILTLNESHYTPDAASILSGKGGGTRYFSFKALDSGTVNITFEYVKTENFERKIASTYIYTYVVDEKGEIVLQNIQ